MPSVCISISVHHISGIRVMVKAFRECVVRMNPSQRYRSGAFLFWDSFVVVGLAKPHVYGIVQYKPSKRVLKGLAYACEVIRHAASGMVMDDSRMLSEAGTMLNDFICVKSNALKYVYTVQYHLIGVLLMNVHQ